MMLVLFTDSDNIIGMMIVSVNNVVLMNDVVLVIDYVAMLNDSAVVAAVILAPVVSAVAVAPAAVISFTVHLKFLTFVDLILASTAFAISTALDYARLF